jgi:HPt (histidine-containing phosphotransfer) domain-containing protein
MISDPLLSEFAGDDEMAELLRLFVDGLAGTCRQLGRGLEAGDVPEVRRIGHQLKGTGGGYGYPDLSAAGRRLEEAVVAAVAVTDDVRAAAAEVMLLCRRARAGVPG